VEINADNSGTPSNSMQQQQAVTPNRHYSNSQLSKNWFGSQKSIRKCLSSQPSYKTLVGIAQLFLNLSGRLDVERTCISEESVHEHRSPPRPTSAEPISAQDFIFRNVIGQGAFGKVMLVQKKNGKHAGKVYAMKVLKKSVVAEKGQIEHTKSEFQIFSSIKHPFICRLRFAFQSEDKLYLVTDYYCGGSLFYHLRKASSFPEERARFYMSEILLAIEHLHSHQIIYRDLKLENVIMDVEGHIAITDFGLSKMHCEIASTFCGTAEYMAPELIKGQTYGVAVDWWSFGILLYEMIVGRTPFFDKNRKLMFQKIVKANPEFPDVCSSETCSIVRRLLASTPTERLGTGETGATEIKQHSFFLGINFQDSYKRTVEAPFKPEISQNEAKYVPNLYLAMDAKDSGDASPQKANRRISLNEFKGFQYDGTPRYSCEETVRT